MKKVLLAVSFAALLGFAIGCSDSDGESASPVAQCTEITSLTVAQNFGELNISLTAAPGALYYELSSLQASSEHNPDWGQISSLGSENETIDIGFWPQSQVSVLYYVRSVCPDGTKGAWFGPKMLNVQPYCDRPEISNVSEFGINWNSVSEANSYQLQYGPAGFALGTGTTATITGNNYYGDLVMAAGQTYDFYVRANCVNNGGFGAWSVKYSYTATSNVNMCVAPTNLTAVYNGSTSVNFHWNWNGESLFEYVRVNPGASPTSGTIQQIGTTGWPGWTINSGTHFDFYVRAVCANGNRTAWVMTSI